MPCAMRAMLDIDAGNTAIASAADEPLANGAL